MRFEETAIPGCYRIACPVHKDRRGRLVKAFQQSKFARNHFELEAGIAWDSIGATWPTNTPMLSDRDAVLPRLSDFRSPFRFVTEAVRA